jgi:hypothetical protein
LENLFFEAFQRTDYRGDVSERIVHDARLLGAEASRESFEQRLQIHLGVFENHKTYAKLANTLVDFAKNHLEAVRDLMGGEASSGEEGKPGEEGTPSAAKASASSGPEGSEFLDGIFGSVEGRGATEERTPSVAKASAPVAGAGAGSGSSHGARGSPASSNINNALNFVWDVYSGYEHQREGPPSEAKAARDIDPHQPGSEDTIILQAINAESDELKRLIALVDQLAKQLAGASRSYEEDIVVMEVDDDEPDAAAPSGDSPPTMPARVDIGRIVRQSFIRFKRESLEADPQRTSVVARRLFSTP